MLRSLEQDRAKYAWECINEVKEKSYEGEYKSYVQRAPTLILANGLSNTLAFWRSKKEKEAYNRLYEHINGWFNRHNTNKDLLEWIISENTSSLDVFKETKEMLALLNWLKRFAEAELKGEERE